MLVKRLIISLTLKGRGCVKYGGKPVKGGRLFRGDKSATKIHFNWRRPRVSRSAVRLLQPSLSYCQWLAADKTIVSFFSCEVNALNSLVCREVGRALCSKCLKKKRKLLLFWINKLWQLLLSGQFVLFLFHGTHEQVVVHRSTQASVSSRTFYGHFQQPAEKVQAVQVWMTR